MCVLSMLLCFDKIVVFRNQFVFTLAAGNNVQFCVHLQDVYLKSTYQRAHCCLVFTLLLTPKHFVQQTSSNIVFIYLSELGTC